MASVQSVQMNYDPLSTAPSGTKRKIGDVGPPSGSPNDVEAETPSSHELGGDADANERGEMSESKRRAQNRAAQRAFRERKERHLKELETRLAQLESESRSWKSTNMALRSQLSLLEEELQHYRRPQGAEASQQPQQPALELDTQSSGLPAHMLPRQMPSQQQQQQQQYQPSQLQGSADRNGQAHDARSSSSHNGNSPESMSIPGLSFDSPGSGSSSTPNRADEFCDKLSLACGTRDRPVPIGAPQIAAESPRWQEDAVLNGLNSDWARRSSWAGTNGFAPVTNLPGEDMFQLPGTGVESASSLYPGMTPNKGANDDPLNLDFGIMASGFGGFGTPSGSKPAEQPFSMSPFPTNNNVSGLLNNDYGMFDPLEDMLEWNPSKEATQPTQTQTQTQPQQQQQQQQLGALPSHQQTQQQRPSHTTQQVPPRRTQGASPSTSGNSPKTPTFKMEEPDMGAMGLGFFGDGKDMGPLAGLEEQVPAASQRFIPCSDVWDRICSHPRFGEIDINSMCQELRSRARCSNTGVVLDEEDVNKVLGTIE